MKAFIIETNIYEVDIEDREQHRELQRDDDAGGYALVDKITSGEGKLIRVIRDIEFTAQALPTP